MLCRRSLLAALTATVLRPCSAAFAGTDVSADALLRGRGLYLPYLRMLRAEVAKGGPFEIPNLELLSQFYAIVGDEVRAFATDYDAMVRNRQVAPPTYSDSRQAAGSLLEGATFIDALDVITEMARGRRVVILNEAHHVSRCRAFAASVALRLKDIGFAVFAAEALSPDIESRVSINAADQSITTDFGLYASDPEYAEMLRTARRSGLILAPYEQRDDQRDAGNDPRERAQVDNIIKLLDSGRSIMVFCGFGHVIKTERPGGGYALAGLLRRETGLEPLCIDQSQGVPPPAQDQESVLLKAIINRFRPTRPIAVMRSDGTALGIDRYGAPGAIDLAIYQPRVRTRKGRPGWLASDSRRVPLRFELPRPTRDYSIVRAVPLREARLSENAVPADQYPPLMGTRSVELYVPAGNYELQIESIGERQVLGTVVV